MKLIDHLRANKLLPRNLARKRRIAQPAIRKVRNQAKRVEYRDFYEYLTFRDTIDGNIRAIERILYNRKLGTVSFAFRFEGCNWQKIKIIDEVMK